MWEKGCNLRYCRIFKEKLRNGDGKASNERKKYFERTLGLVEHAPKIYLLFEEHVDRVVKFEENLRKGLEFKILQEFWKRNLKWQWESKV